MIYPHFRFNKAMGRCLRAALCLILSLFIIVSCAIVPYQKAKATGGEVIAAIGSVAVPVALATLAVIAGVVVYNEVQAAGGLEEFGEQLQSNLNQFIENNADAPSKSEVSNWLYNFSIGKLKIGDIYDFIKEWLRSLRINDEGGVDTSTPASNSITINGTSYAFNENIHRAVCGSGTLAQFTQTNAPIKGWDFTFDNFSGSSAIYASYYINGANSFLIFSSESSFSYRKHEIGYGADQEVIYNSSRANPTINGEQFPFYYDYYSFNPDDFRLIDIGFPASSRTDSTYSLYQAFKITPKLLLQGFLMVYGGYVDSPTQDDVIIKNPSLLGGGLLTGENNDVISKDQDWTLVNGGDVVIGEGEVDLPGEVSVEWPISLTLEEAVAAYLAGEITWEQFLKILGVLGIDPATGYTIVTDPSISEPIDRVAPYPINGTNPPPSNENKPFTFPYDLSRFFPFCIPFDLLDFIGCLSASPQTPVFTIGLPDPKHPGQLVSQEISLEKFDDLAEKVRAFECLVFIFVLIVITRDKMIKG